MVLAPHLWLSVPYQMWRCVFQIIRATKFSAIFIFHCIPYEIVSSCKKPSYSGVLIS